MNPTILRRLPIYATGVGFALGLTVIAISREWNDLLTLGVGLGVAAFYTLFVLVPHLVREQQPEVRSRDRTGHAGAEPAQETAAPAHDTGAPTTPRASVRWQAWPPRRGGSRRRILINAGGYEWVAFAPPATNAFSLSEDATLPRGALFNAEFRSAGGDLEKENLNDEEEANIFIVSHKCFRECAKFARVDH